jgi:hypothetical protein
VAFAAFLRSGEFTWDNWTSTSSTFSIAMYLGRTSNSIPTLSPSLSWRQQTDPFREGIAIQLASSQTSPFCPVRALRQLYTVFPDDPSPPLFSRSFGPSAAGTLSTKSKNCYCISTSFSGHSLCKGARYLPHTIGCQRMTSNSAVGVRATVDTYINEISQPERSRKLLQHGLGSGKWQNLVGGNHDG